MTARTEHLRASPAPDYWKLSAFYVPQFTSSACSVASVAMAVNFARGLPAGAETPIVTQPALLEEVGDEAWTDKGAEGGAGVTFAEFLSVPEGEPRALRHRGLRDRGDPAARRQRREPRRGAPGARRQRGLRSTT